MTMGTVADIIRTYGRERARGTAISFEDRELTWGELDRRSSQVANALRAAGVSNQERVAFVDKNGLEYFEVLFGGAKIGAVNVGVNWRLAPVEMADIINDAQARVLFVGTDYLAHLEKMEDKLETVRTVVVLGGHGRHQSYEPWVEGQPADDPGFVAPGEDVALQLYTSGTTGLPKGVMLTHDNLFHLLPTVTKEWDVRPGDVSLVAMPLFHIGGSGWALAGMSNGAESVLLREVVPATILERIAAKGVTHAFLVPAVLQFLLATPGIDTTDFSKLRVMVYGASPISDEVLVACLRTFSCDFVGVYGLTETTGAVTQLDSKDHQPDSRPDLLRSCGKPYPGVELRIVDAETERDLPAGEVGEVWIRTEQNMKGYWNKPEETARTKTPDNWVRTGDAGYLDGEGFLYLYDRVKDMIVSGGENIYPAEVENVLMSHPAVADVAVIGVPDDRWGEAVKAIVVRGPDAEVTAEDIITFARERLAGYKLPKSVDFAQDLPRNPSGKLLKRELREPYWEGKGRRIN